MLGIGTLFAKVFGTANDRVLKKYKATIDKVNAFEAELQGKSDDQIKAKTAEFKERLSKGETLDELLPEAFAVVREASRRTLGLRHYDVQLMGGLALHQGCVAEMKTGEGKTLMATLPLYLNALAGQGAHLVTVNDYLARRDADWMRPVYEFLGLTVAALQNEHEDDERQAVYAADIVYGTNNEFGFDYLRDNMKFDITDYVQRDLSFAIVDEVDSILIDEARTPLIISGPSEKDTGLYKVANDAVKKLSKEAKDYEVDEKARTSLLTESGIDKVEKFLNITNIYAPENVLMLHHVQQALKAHTLFKRDVDYMLTPDKEVLIVDEFTGRALAGRRYSDGLHQAIEAKEGVEIERENQTLATITLQNYFRMYSKLAGMTGTANTDAEEFYKIYKLNVIVIPTHKPMIRTDEDDVIYLTQKSKYKAVVDDILDCHKKGQPVLVGTASIESSELLSTLLRMQNVPHEVLNAKQHEREAEIVKHAGERGKITISTSMAGRGTDIKLGPDVPELGGLRVVATERYENRRVDDQLRGRSGRQGDPGSSKFYISLEDDLMRIFGGDRNKRIMETYGGMEEDEALEHSLVNYMIKDNQQKLEARNFDTRKHLLEYDDVMNQQRNVIYKYRRNILTSTQTLQELIISTIKQALSNIFDAHAPNNEYDPHGYRQIIHQLEQLTDLQEADLVPADYNGNNTERLFAVIFKALKTKYQQYRTLFSPEEIEQAEKWGVLSIVDYAWKTHLQNLDHLKEGIGLRGYGQKNPLYEYKKEAFAEFEQMIQATHWDIAKRIFKLKEAAINAQELREMKAKRAKELEEIQLAHQQQQKQASEAAEKKAAKKKKKGGGFYGR